MPVSGTVAAPGMRRRARGILSGEQWPEMHDAARSFRENAAAVRLRILERECELSHGEKRSVQRRRADPPKPTAQVAAHLVTRP